MTKKLLSAFAAFGIFAFPAVFASDEEADYSSRELRPEGQEEFEKQVRQNEKSEYKRIKLKQKRGETLTEEESAFLQDYKTNKTARKNQKKANKLGMSIEDIKRAKEIKQKEKNGETLSEEETELLNKYRQLKDSYKNKKKATKLEKKARKRENKHR